MQDVSAVPVASEFERALEAHRGPLTGYCYRMLGSPFDAEDAVQETLMRVRLRPWLYRIATNVCLDQLHGRSRRALPVDLGPASPPDPSHLNTRPRESWVEPIPDALLGGPPEDPAETALARETLRLAFVAALQQLPPRQRAVLILCEALRFKATEAAALLDTTVASVNSALQRARATLADADVQGAEAQAPLAPEERELLDRYLTAFERYDIEALSELIREDAVQSMPPYDMWLSGREDILAWWVGPGAECRGSRVLPAGTANGLPAFGQYRRSQRHQGWDPWALQVLELREGQIARITSFLEPAELFARFRLPPRIERG
jgi:RNA polymerase sigma-70 factor (ECF subfamily)